MEKNYTFSFFLVVLMTTMSTTQATARFASQMMAQLKNTIQKEFISTHQTTTSSMLMMPCSGASGEIGGTVFSDYNKDGLDNQVGVGVEGAEVFIFSCDASGNSALLTSMMTDDNGDYTFTGLTDGDNYRLEFVAPTGYMPGFGGDDNGTDVQFATSPTCAINAAFSLAEDYCSPAATPPNLILTCFVNGDPLATPSDVDTEETIVLFPYDAANTSPTAIKLAEGRETGAVYSLVYQRRQKRLFTSAFVKRHVGIGPLGLGGIYTTDISDIGQPVTTPFIDVATLGINVGTIPSNTARGLTGDAQAPSNDVEGFDGVGKLGIGAMALSADENTLWFVSLNDQTLYSLVIDSDNNFATPPTATDLTAFPLPDASCTNGTFRPFAVKIHRGEVYIGGVCDGAMTGTTADLEAIVYHKTGATFNQILRFGLDYQKGYANKDGDCDLLLNWNPWRADIPPACTGNGIFRTWPTPMLTDLEFDVDGSMILGFTDRMGHQIGYKNYPLTGTTPLLQAVSSGDLLRAYNNNGTFEIENNATAGPNTTSGAGNMQGPGGGEYYYQDIFEGQNSNLTGEFQPHRETSQGALAMYVGSGEIATSSLDPYDTDYRSGGVNWMNNTSASVRNPGYIVYTSQSSDITNFQKANGLGDLLLVCELAPIEIGGTIWEDNNANGVQDACEPLLNGVHVSLYDGAGNALASTTSTNGAYYFNENTIGLDTILPNTTYHIAIGTNGDFENGFLQNQYSLTTANTGMTPNADKNDSDAMIAAANIANGAVTGFPTITITTGGFGFVDHSSDIGFQTETGISGFVWQDNDENGLQDVGELGIEGVTVTLFTNANVQVGQAVMTDAAGNYIFTDVLAGDYYVVFDENTNTANIANYAGTLQNQGNDTSIDSDANASNGRTPDFSYNPITDDILTNIDAGFFTPTGTIGGFVWDDDNINGLQDVGELGIEGITVTLYDNNDNVVGTATTNANGNYTFDNIPLGSYYAIFDKNTNTDGITNYQGSPQNQGNGTNDSEPDANTGQTDLFNFDPTNGDNTNVDAGFFIATGNVGGFVWDDSDENGIQDATENGIEGVTVTLFASDGTFVETVTTGSTGLYSFSNVPLGDYYVIFDETTNTSGLTDYQNSPQNQGNGMNDSDPNDTGRTLVFSFDPDLGNNNDIDAGFLRPTGIIGGFAWDDNNQDGIQDIGELGIEGVTVSLYQSNGTFITNTTTDANGNYAFNNLNAGNYYIIFDETTNTANIPDYQGSPQSQGNGTNDSDASPTNGQTSNIIFAPSNGDLTDVDAGFFQPNGSIIGFAWTDVDEDGIFDNDEPGIGGVTVTLYAADGTFITTTTTDASGMYTFPGVGMGDYYVIFDETTNTAGNNDYQETLQNVGDDNFDSDAAPNTGRTNTFTFNPLGMNNNVNAGYTLPVVLGSIGDFVFLDFNKNGIQDAGEFGLINVPVTLNGVNNVTVLNTTTDANGAYVFENIAPGTYTITFGFPPNFTELEHSPQNQGGNEAIDSDANTISGTTNVFTLINNENKDDIDAGYFDSKKPTFPNPSGDITINCSDPEFDNPTPPNAIDDFDNNVMVTLEEVVNNNGGLCNGEFIIIRTWTATDDFGNTETYVQNVTVLDNEPPVLLGVPADGMADCDNIPAWPEVKAVDNCDDEVQIDSMQTFGGEGCNRTLTRKWTATDDCGNSTMDTQLLFLMDITPPEITFTHPDLIGLMDGDTVYVQWTDNLPFSEEDATATDACTEAEVEMYDFVSQGGICAQDGFIWEMMCVWEATDLCGNMSELSLIVYFVDTEPPVLAGIPQDITVECEEVPENTAIVTASDTCDDEVFVTYLETTSGSICDDYTVTRRWSAIDDCGNVIVEEQIITVNVDELKIVGVPDDLFINCDDDIPPPANPILLGDCYNPVLLFEETILGNECDDYKIIRQWTGRNDCGIIVTEVQTIHINVPDLEFLEFPQAINVDCHNIPNPVEPPLSQYCFNTMVEFQEDIIGDTCHDYKLVRKWTAMNDCGQMAMVSQTITVEVPDFEWDIPENITINCEDPLPPLYMPTFSGLCYDVMVDVIVDSIPGSCQDEYKINRVYKATTSCGDQHTETHMITVVDDEAPTIIISNPIFDNLEDGDTLIVACGEIPLILPGDAIATDNCDPNPMISFTENITSSSDCAFEGFMLKMNCGWIAIDRCGNLTKKEICIIVADQVPPVISGVPGNTTVNTANGETIPVLPSNVVVIDNCADSPFMSFSETIETQDGQCGYTVLRTWSAADDCGNTNFSTQAIQVLDVCECPNIVINDFVVKDAICNDNNGSIRVNTGSDPAIFDYSLVPDVGTTNDDGNERYDLSPGSYLLLIYLPNVDDCIEKIYFDIGQGNCIDTLQVTMLDQLTQICLDELTLDYEGTITNTQFCNIGTSSTVIGTEINNECVTVSPMTGYDGSETICVIHCFNGSSSDCDTTYIEITVEPEIIECNLQANAFAVNPTCGNTDGNIQVNVIGGEGDLSYQWNPNVSSTSSAANLDGGIYDITITDQSTNCTTTTSVTLVAPQVAIISEEDVTVNHILCPENGTGSIVSNTGLVYQVWTTTGLGFGDTPVNELSAGDYRVLYTNTDGCTDSIAVSINQPDALQFSISTMPESCTENDGVISIGVNADSDEFTWIWTPDVSSSGTASGLTAGTIYSVSITDEMGCSMTLTDLTVTQDCDETCSVVAGTISTNDPTSFCIEDGEEDFVNLSVSGNSGNYTFAVIDVNGIILLVSENPVFNFEGESEGNLSIVGIAFDGMLNNLVTGQNIATIEGCFEISNSISIEALGGGECQEACSAASGTIFTTDETVICADDGAADIINISITGDVVGDYMYIVTNSDSIILGLSSDAFINLEGSGAGTCLIWGLASQNGVMNAEINNHLSEIVGCLDLSNPIPVIRNIGEDCSNSETTCTVNAGTLQTDAPTTICVDDGQSDLVSVTATGSTGTYLYLITTADSTILTTTSTSTFMFDFENMADAGQYFIWGLASEGVISGNENGGNLMNIEGCTALSDPIIITALDGSDCTLVPDCLVDADAITTTDATTLCVDDNEADIVNVTHNSSATNYMYLVTTADSIVLGMSSNPSFNFEGDGAGLCLIWGIAYEDTTPTINTGDHISSINTADCIDLTEPILIKRQTEEDCETNNPNVVAEICDNGIDDDNDGLIDCQDPDCCGFEVCSNVFDLITDTIGVINCIGETQVCFDIPFNLTNQYTIDDNGTPYTGIVAGCNFDTTLAYSYFSIPAQGATGPYTLNSWAINGTTFSGEFFDLDALLDSMNTWDNSGLWAVNQTSLTITGGSSSSTYSNMVITQNSDGATSILELNTNFVPLGSSLDLELGLHRLVFTHNVSGCTDTIKLLVECRPELTNDVIEVTLALNTTDTLCLDITELPSNINVIDWFCIDEDNCSNVDFNMDNNCLIFTGTDLGIDSVQVIICDDLDFCDTTWVVINVNTLTPIARIDADTIAQNDATIIHVINNDDWFGNLVGVQVVTLPEHGELVLNMDNSFTYTPTTNYCGVDAFSYELCNAVGCDTASVYLLISCEGPVVFEGFSPNGDGMNDNFYIGGMEQYPINELQIFDRWGAQVHYAKNYKNSWDGTWQGKTLPDGVYFYLFNFGDNEKMTGYIYLRR